MQDTASGEVRGAEGPIQQPAVELGVTSPTDHLSSVLHTVGYNLRTVLVATRSQVGRGSVGARQVELTTEPLLKNLVTGGAAELVLEAAAESPGNRQRLPHARIVVKPFSAEHHPDSHDGSHNGTARFTAKGDTGKGRERLQGVGGIDIQVFGERSEAALGAIAGCGQKLAGPLT